MRFLHLTRLPLALIAGSSIVAHAQDASTDSVAASATLMREIDVLDTRAQSSTPSRKVDTVTLGAFGKASWQATPFSIQTVTEERLRNQQGSSLTDVLKAQPLVQSQTGGSRVTDYFASRGFTSSVWTSNTSVEGLLSHNPVEPVEDKDRVEVMNGPNSFLYGVTSPGGMVNSVLKRPTDTLLLRATAGDYGGSQCFAHADVGGSIGSFGYRSNLLYVTKGSAGVEKQTNERYLGSAALDWKIFPTLKWSIDGSVFHRDAEHTQSIWMIGSASKAPDAPDASKNWGSSQGFAKDDDWRTGTRLEWKPFPALHLRGDVRYTEFSREFVLLRRNLAKGDSTYTLRADYQGKNANSNSQGDFLADYTLSTGAVEQTITAGFVDDYLMTKVPQAKYSKVWTSARTYANGSDYPSVPLFDTIVNSGSPYRDSVEVETRSALLLDRVSIGKFLDVFAGANFASIISHAWNGTTGTTTSYDKSALSPSAAVVYSPIRPVSVYASYIQALQQGPAAPNDPNCTNANQTLDPYTSHQVELGVKANVLGSLNLHLAGFWVDQSNLYYDTVVGTKTYEATEDGREVHKGVEFSAQGKVLPSLSLSVGASALEATIEKTSTAALQDKSPQGVAEAMGKFGAEWAIPLVPGLFVNGTANYTGKEWVNTANTISIPSVVTGDVGLRYERLLGRHLLAVRAAVTNVSGEDYWTTRSGILYLGDPRTFLASAECTW